MHPAHSGDDFSRTIYGLPSTDSTRCVFDSPESKSKLADLLPSPIVAHKPKLPLTQAEVCTRFRPHACNFPGCNKTFTKKWNLQVHQRIHTGSKPYKCRLGCGESMMWPSSRQSHERRRCRLLSSNTPGSRKIVKNISKKPISTGIENPRTSTAPDIVSEIEQILERTSEILLPKQEPMWDKEIAFILEALGPEIQSTDPRVVNI